MSRAWRTRSPLGQIRFRRVHHKPSVTGPAAAGYEIRWWSPQNVHEVADLFVFPTARDAARYVRQAASLRCRDPGAVSRPLAEPLGAKSLIWNNPLGYLQADVFFSRGNRAYRVSQVPPGPIHQVPAHSDVWRLLETPQQVACQLADARCEIPMLVRPDYASAARGPRRMLRGLDRAWSGTRRA